MRRRLFRVLCVLGLLGVEAAAARADVAAYLGRTVGSVRLVLEGRETTDPMLTHIVLTAAGQPLSKIARELKAKGQYWMAIGDENYGEGSSREHAAMSPRYFGCVVVLVRSFARIHETNLKKQGILPLTFSKPTDYDLVGLGDRVSVTGLAELTPGKPVTVTLTKPDRTTASIQCLHTLTDEQIGWFKAGSALNALK